MPTWPIAEAYEKLGVRVEDVRKQPQITPQLKAIAAVIRRAGQQRVTHKLVSQHGDAVDIKRVTEHVPPYGPGSDIARSWPWYLDSSADPEARKVLDVYYAMPRTLARILPVEAFCLSVAVSPLRILEILTATAVRLGAQASMLVAAVSHPRVTQKTVEMALTDEGTEDRATLHKATGFLPTPRGAQTNITIAQNASAQANAQAASVTAPPPEATIRRMVNRFNDARGTPALPASVEGTVLPEVMPHEDLEVVEVVEDRDDNEREEEAELTP
jgi:hypothetical protein